MFQMRDENEPVLSYLKEERDDAVSIGTSEEDSFIPEKRQRSTRACSRQWYMRWLKYVLFAAAWIISIIIAVYVSGQRHNGEGLSKIAPTELRKLSRLPRFLDHCILLGTQD